jgi:CRP/FNR family cyclic AMP-dependent transcriptional regulator
MKHGITFLEEPSGGTPNVCDFRPYLSMWDAPQEYPRNTILYLQGCIGDCLYYVEQGLIKLAVVDALGGECIVAIRHPGWLLGISAVILQGDYPATATTLTACTLRSIRRKKFLENLQENIELSFGVNRMLCEEIGYHLTKQSHLSRLCATKRLETLLLDFIVEEYRGKKLPRTFEIPLRNHEIAEIIGATEEHTSRLLKKMENDGLVLRTRSNLMILRPQDLLSSSSNS